MVHILFLEVFWLIYLFYTFFLLYFMLLPNLLEHILFVDQGTSTHIPSY
jgi:hypothetical protein